MKETNNGFQKKPRIDVSSGKRIQIMYTKKNAHILNEIEEFVELSPQKNKTAVIIELLELGLNCYKSGFRLLDNQLFKKV